MGNFFNRIKDDIIREFGIRNINNLEILKQASTGFSGAEVYCINLKNDSDRKGIYYLKIDPNSDEYDNSVKSQFSRKGVLYLEKKKINDYYVILIQLAGKSMLEYISFYKLESPTKRREIVKRVFDELFEDAVDKKGLVKESIRFTQLFKIYLQNKLDKEGELKTYLEKVLKSSDVCITSGIQFNDRILPNPYAYAVEEKLGDKLEFSPLICYQHGDLHGDNLLVSKEENEYSIIDFALCRQDGYLFFDSAYFSLSLLLHVFQGESIVQFVNDITRVVQKDYDNIGFRKLEVIKSIDEVEDMYITRICDESFSHNDLLMEAKYIARVLAGLNYAGKKNVADDLREKAFLFASLYLKKLFKYINYEDWIDGRSLKWYGYAREETSDKKAFEMKRFIEECNYFSQEQRYILVVGDNYNYDNDVVDGIQRIPWSGIISFCNNDKDVVFRDIIDKTKLLRQIVLGKSDNGDSIQQGSTWWMFVNGLPSMPNTISDSFPVWRKKNRLYLEESIQQIGQTYSPDDIMIILDRNSFKDCKEHLQRLMEEFDYIDTEQINVAILKSVEKIDETGSENYVNLSINDFNIGLNDLSVYCMENLSSSRYTKSYVPHLENKLGVQLEEEDEHYINEYVTLVNDALLERENFDVYGKRYSFYWGEPITWTAISEKLYVERKEIKGYIEDVINIIEKEKSSEAIILNIPHSPGAGASIICKVICWELRNTYPTIIVASINENMYECCRRLSSISGKHILAVLDGDYSQNDVIQLQATLNSRNIKSVILYTYRQYQMKIEDPDNNKKLLVPLDVLSTNQGIVFKNEYMNRVNDRKLYSIEEKKARDENLSNLTLNMELLRFRLPFFYGMYAFEKDFMGINKYLEDIIIKIKSDNNLKKIINYTAIVSYFTTQKGIFPKMVRKILKLGDKSSNTILKQLQLKFPNLIYSVNNAYRICHPIIALEILKRQLPEESLFASRQFLILCKEFIEDLKKCEGSQSSFDKLNELLMDLFIQRNIEDDLQDDGIKKENFSQIFLSIGNNHSQEELFQCLVEKFPNNSHFAHHYGRLIIANNPSELDKAKKQFDKAVNLEPKNNIHYHARGNAYEKFIMDLVRNKCKMDKPMEIYNKTAQLVHLSLEDYKKSIELIELSKDTVSLRYPYTSIIKICTFIVNQIMRSSGISGEKDKFFEQNNEVVTWCKKLVAFANSYDMDTEYRYTDIRKNDKYNKAKSYLIKLNFTNEELKHKIKSDPKNQYLKISYLNTIDWKREDWNSKTQVELGDICIYCEELMLLESTREGVIWKWFNAYIRLNTFQYTHFFSVLELLPKLENNLTANYFLYIGYFLKYCETRDNKLAQKSLDSINICRRLGKNSNKFKATQWYYSGTGRFPIAIKSEGCKKLNATVVEEIENVQSGYLSLDINPRFRAFFVPAYTNLKKGQAFQKKVEVVIGFSYDGLRAWEVKIRI